MSLLSFLFIIILHTSRAQITSRNSNEQCVNPQSTTSPETVLPRFDPNLNLKYENIEKYYKSAYARCMREYSVITTKYLTEVVSVPRPVQHNDNSNLRCKGPALLHRMTNISVWAFGPASCAINTACWVGVLSCGQPNIESIKLAANTPSNQNSEADHWSIKSLHVHASIRGREILSPQAFNYTQVRTVMKDNGKFIEAVVDVLVGEFVLTIPGEYDVDVGLEGWYPAVMGNKDTGEKINREDNFVYLGGSEYNRLEAFICCNCDIKALIPSTISKLRALISSCFPFRAVTPGINRNKNLRDQKSNSSSLPYCRGGSNSGRWIALPDTVLDICEARPLLDIRESAWQKYGVRSMWKEYGKIVDEAYKEYRLKADAMEPSQIWNRIMCSLSPSNGTRDKNDAKDLQMYRNVLSEYASGNPCLLLYVEPSTTNLGRLAIYAPYSCTYHIYSPSESLQCMLNDHFKRIVFDGDSMSRDLMTYALPHFNNMYISAATMKNMSKLNNKFEFESKDVSVSELYSWDFDLNMLKQTEQTIPDVYITNNGIAHRMRDIATFQKDFNREIIHYWTKRAVPKPKLMIFQNARALHGHRNFHWSAEIFRQLNAVMRDGFVNKLGFYELDEYLITDPLKEHEGDGWHFHGLPKVMEMQVLANMICQKTAQNRVKTYVQSSLGFCGKGKF